VYLIGGLTIGLGALLAKHFCITGSVEPEILFINRNIFAGCEYNERKLKMSGPLTSLFGLGTDSLKLRLTTNYKQNSLKLRDRISVQLKKVKPDNTQ